MFGFDLRKFITTIYLVHLLRFAKTNEQDNGNNNKACRNLIYQYSAINILTIGRINSKILLITKNFYVYELSSDALKGKLQSSAMYLGESYPDPMSEKWPILWNDKRFIKIKHKIYVSFTVMDSNNEYIFFETKNPVSDDQGVVYDIGGNEVRNGLVYKHDYDKTIISSTEKSIVYAIGGDGNGLTIERSTLSYGSLSDSAEHKYRQYRMCVVMNSTKTGYESETGDKFSLQIMMAKSCKTLQLSFPVNCGFHDGEQFYLFGPQALLIFTVQAFSSPDKPYSLIRKDYAEFFVCQFRSNPAYALLVDGRAHFASGSVPPEPPDTAIVLAVNAYPSHTHLIGLALLFVFALALLISVYFCCCKRTKSNKAANESDNLEGYKVNLAGGSKPPPNKKKLKKEKINKNQNKMQIGNLKFGGGDNHHGKVKGGKVLPPPGKGPKFAPKIKLRSKLKQVQPKKTDQSSGSSSSSTSPNTVVTASSAFKK